MRVSLSITITEMARPPNRTDPSLIDDTCPTEDSGGPKNTTFRGTYDWSEYTQVTNFNIQYKKPLEVNQRKRLLEKKKINKGLIMYKNKINKTYNLSRRTMSLWVTVRYLFIDKGCSKIHFGRVMQIFNRI